MLLVYAQVFVIGECLESPHNHLVDLSSLEKTRLVNVELIELDGGARDQVVASDNHGEELAKLVNVQFTILVAVEPSHDLGLDLLGVVAHLVAEVLHGPFSHSDELVVLQEAALVQVELAKTSPRQSARHNLVARHH